jgi:hypothetical protein
MPNKLIGVIAFTECNDCNVPTILLNLYLEIRIVTMNICIQTKLDFNVPDSHQRCPDANNLVAGLTTSSSCE